jgi:hydrogenase expression/formation protein HypD
MLVLQVNNKKPSTQIQYRRAVTCAGNITAKNLVNEVFESGDDYWRGLGLIPSGGLKLKHEYADHNAETLLQFSPVEMDQQDQCICGEILRGRKRPTDCKLFADTCRPESPAGACMVSEEGTCNTYFKYRLNG